MNYLILTCKFGMGHMSVANAIKEDLEKSSEKINVAIVDIIDYILPNSNKILYGAFNILVSKFPMIYNYFYDNFNSSCNAPASFSSVEKIEKLIDIYKPDKIISTMPVCSQFVGKYKKITGDNIAMYTFITDISVSDEWINFYTDKYFIGDGIVKEELIEKGVSSEKIVITGIPVKEYFKSDKPKIIDYRHRYKILMMGGGLGLFSEEYEKIIESFDETNLIEITVITGKNTRAFNYLKNKYTNTVVLGYVDNVDEYMRNSDLIISKPGGITLFESIYSTTPLYVVKPILAQEIKNAKFIEDKNIGRVVWKENDIDIIEDIVGLLNNKSRTSIMKIEISNIKNRLRHVDLARECLLDI